MKLIHRHQPRIVVGVFSKERTQCRSGDILATGKSYVRMPRAKVRFKVGAEGGVAYFLVQLEEVRMTATDTDPENLRITFGRKSAEPVEGEEEGSELNGTQIGPKTFFLVGVDIAEKSEREMDLIGT